MQGERCTCAICGKQTAPRFPVGGDRTARFPHRHNKPIGLPCDGWATECAEDRR